MRIKSITTCIAVYQKNSTVAFARLGGAGSAARLLARPARVSVVLFLLVVVAVVLTCVCKAGGVDLDVDDGVAQAGAAFLARFRWGFRRWLGFIVGLCCFGDTALEGEHAVADLLVNGFEALDLRENVFGEWDKPSRVDEVRHVVVCGEGCDELDGGSEELGVHHVVDGENVEDALRDHVVEAGEFGHVAGLEEAHCEDDNDGLLLE